MTGWSAADAATTAEALAAERAVWEALVAGDKAADEALLSPDFVGVYATGFSARAGHAGQLDDGPSVARYAIEEARVMVPGPDLALVAYLARFARAASPEREEAMYVGSLWRRVGGRWVNLYSQDTAAEG
ncbi:MAG: nuclear transport factor 2 family protein [Pseudomonadota bacterium]